MKAPTKVKAKNQTTTKTKTKAKKRTRITVRKIPKNKLENALKIINDPTDPIWVDRNVSCNIAVHHAIDQVPLEVTKIKCARICLLRRDWRNLAKVVMISNPNVIPSTAFYVALFAKYSAICLAHNKDKALFETYLKSVISYGEKDTTIKKCTEYPSLI